MRYFRFQHSPLIFVPLKFIADMPLYDTFGRIHNYLRISLIDVCNFNCTYCVPQHKIGKMKSEALMSVEEIYHIAGIFIQHGVNKIRLTGGEPTIRKEFGEILEKLSAYPIELTLTTNGFLIDRHIDVLKKANVKSLNLSIDSLKPEIFFAITKTDRFEQVYKNIFLLLDHGFSVKLNVVLMKGVNDHEIFNFVELTRNYPLHLRFIEFMPFTDNAWERSNMISYCMILDQLLSRYNLLKLSDEIHDTTKKFKVAGYAGTLAVISSVTEPFCSGCNRMRLSADGKMRNCLFAQSHIDLLTAFRNGEDIVPLIFQNVKEKAAQYGGQLMTSEIKNSNMLVIGG